MKLKARQKTFSRLQLTIKYLAEPAKTAKCVFCQAWLSVFGPPLSIVSFSASSGSDCLLHSGDMIACSGASSCTLF